MQLQYCIATQKEHFNRFFNARPDYEYQKLYRAANDMFLPAITDKNPNLIVELKWHFPWPEDPVPLLAHFIPVDKILAHWKQPRKIRFILLKAIRHNRCVVLANCFVVRSQNQLFCVYVQDQRLFGFGAIWNETKSHTGFALLTQSPNKLMEQLGQPEMPFILNEWQVRRWLVPSTSTAKLSALMKVSYPSEKMNAYLISSDVYDSGIDSSKIFNPVGEKINPETYYGAKEKLVRQGWGRNKLNEDW